MILLPFPNHHPFFPHPSNSMPQHSSSPSTHSPIPTLHTLSKLANSQTTTHLERSNTVNHTRDNVKLLLGTLVVVTLPLEPDADTARGGLDTAGPDGLVQRGGDTDVLDTHSLLGKGGDGLDGLGGLCRG